MSRVVWLLSLLAAVAVCVSSVVGARDGSPVTLGATCPPQASRQIDLCVRLVRLISREGGVYTTDGFGLEVCSMQQFAEDARSECTAVYDHVAKVSTMHCTQQHTKHNTQTTADAQMHSTQHKLAQRDAAQRLTAGQLNAQRESAGAQMLTRDCDGFFLR